VGFEPTVGCPTLDFESSALNRTQPPFPGSYYRMRDAVCNLNAKALDEDAIHWSSCRRD
jgi:hypothetical protein